MKIGPALWVIVVALLGACAKQTRIECGEGTELRDGKCVVSQAPGQGDTAAPAPKPAEAEPAQEPTKPESPWKYESEPDAMRGGSLEFASIESTNEVGVDYGQAKLIIAFRQKTGEELEAIVALTGGLVDCSNVCSFEAKFDDGPVERVVALEGSRKGAIFVAKPKEWLPKIRAAGKLIVEVKLFQGGRRQFFFDGLNQLEWPRPEHATP